MCQKGEHDMLSLLESPWRAFLRKLDSICKRSKKLKIKKIERVHVDEIIIALDS